MTDETCSFRQTAEDVDAVVRYEDYRCERDQWRDSDYCILHTDGADTEEERPIREVMEKLADEGRLDGAKLSGLEFPRGSTLEIGDRSCVGLEADNIDVGRIHASNSRLMGSSFEGADTIYFDFSGSDLRGANLDGMTGHWSEFQGANLGNLDANDSTLIGADFTEAEMANAHLINANLVGAIFKEADLGGAILDEADLTNSDFRGAKLHNTDIRDATLQDAIFRGAHLSRTTEITLAHEEQGEWEIAAEVYHVLANLMDENGYVDRRWQMYENRQEALREHDRQQGKRRSYLLRTIWKWGAGYGADPKKIAARAGGLILVYSLLYPLGGLRIHSGQLVTYWAHAPTTLPKGLGYSVYYSLSTFTSLGLGDILPSGLWTRLLTVSEAILGALAIALFVFTLGRRAT